MVLGVIMVLLSEELFVCDLVERLLPLIIGIFTLEIRIE